MELRDIPVDQLVLSEDNIRSKATNIPELAQSIAHSGLLTPLMVSPLADGTYKVVAGERRTLAVRLINANPSKFGAADVIASVPATVQERSDSERVVAMLIENLQREDISPLDEARGYLRLVDEGGFTQKDVADRVGRSKAHISKRLTLLTLPPSAQRQLEAGKLTMEVALQLAKLAEAPEVVDKLVDDYFDPDHKREPWERDELEDDGTIPQWEIEDALRAIDRSKLWNATRDKIVQRAAVIVEADVSARKDEAPEGKVFTWFDEVEASAWNGTLPDDEVSIVELSWVGATLYLNFYGYCDEDAPDLVDTGPWGDRPARPTSSPAQGAEAEAREAERKKAERISRLVDTRRTEHEQAWLATVAAKPKAADLKVLLQRYMAAEVTQYNAKEVAVVLGIEPVVTVHPVTRYESGKGYVEVEGKTRTERDYTKAVRSYLLASDANAQRVMFVLAFKRAQNWGEANELSADDPDVDVDEKQTLAHRIKAENGYVPFDEAKAKVEAEAKVANRKAS